VDSYHQELAPKEETILQADSEITKEMRLATLEKMERSATWVQQFMVLLVRGLKERRHDYLNWLKFVQVVTLSVIVGLLWWQSKLDTETELSGQLGLVFFIAIFWGMYPLFTAIFSFPLERAMLMKERASDLYSLTAYFFARTLGDLPLDLVLPSIFLIIVYFMTNLRRTAGAFLLSVISVYLFVIAAQVQHCGLVLLSLTPTSFNKKNHQRLHLVNILLVIQWIVQRIRPLGLRITHFDLRNRHLGLRDFTHLGLRIRHVNPPQCRLV